jgi:tetratricopeptide (TPR) repeat protein
VELTGRRRTTDNPGVRFAYSLGLLVAIATAAPAARAQDKGDAEGLFNAGRELMQQNRFAEGCPKLAQSQRIVPAVGTALNLGLCYERLGHLASAVAAYQDALTLASALGPSEVKRITLAKDRLAALEPRLSKLSISVAEDAPGLEVKRDGVSLGKSQFGAALPVDPIAHVVEASAPGKQPWRTTVTLTGDASTVAVVVPALADAQVAAPAAPARETGPRVEPVKVVTKHPVALTVGLGAVGLVALSAGTVLALDAKSKYADADSLCDARGCAPQAASIQDDALARGNVATILFVGGGVAVAAAAVAWFVWPGAQRETRVGVGPGGVFARGSF